MLHWGKTILLAYIGISALYVAVWLLLSGFFTPLLLTFGAVSCLFVLWIAHRMQLLNDDLPSFGLLLRYLAYLPWLLIEIAKSNWRVITCILSPQLPISPTVLRIDNDQNSDLARVIHANSITLTPGTVTMRVEDNYFEVHALTLETAEDLQQGAIDRRVSRLEGQ